MSRLWKVALAGGLCSAVTLADALRFDRSAWPAVALFCVSAVVACIAAVSDSAEAQAKADEAEDANDALEVHKKAIAKEIATMAEVVNRQGVDIDHLKKRNVYGDTLGG